MEIGRQIQFHFGIWSTSDMLGDEHLLIVYHIDGRFYFRYGPITEVLLIHLSQWERQKVGVINTFTQCL